MWFVINSFLKASLGKSFICSTNICWDLIMRYCCIYEGYCSEKWRKNRWMGWTHTEHIKALCIFSFCSEWDGKPLKIFEHRSEDLNCILTRLLTLRREKWLMKLSRWVKCLWEDQGSGSGEKRLNFEVNWRQICFQINVKPKRGIKEVTKVLIWTIRDLEFTDTDKGHKRN